MSDYSQIRDASHMIRHHVPNQETLPGALLEIAERLETEADARTLADGKALVTYTPEEYPNGGVATMTSGMIRRALKWMTEFERRNIHPACLGLTKDEGASLRSFVNMMYPSMSSQTTPEAKAQSTICTSPEPKGFDDDVVAYNARHYFGKAEPWIIEMRRRGYAVELHLQVHVSTIGGTPEADQVIGGLRFTKSVQVVL